MNERLATAEWTDPDVFAEAHRFEVGDFWLGRSLGRDDTPLGHRDPLHTLLVSGSGGGKGATCIINNLCLWPGSIVVLDPKGENATITANRRGAGSDYCEGLGQDVHVLDPFGVAKVKSSYRSSFNPLDTLDPSNEDSVNRAARIASALVVVENIKEPFWAQHAQTMVQGLILHVLTAPEFEGERNLLTVRDLLTRGDWKAQDRQRELGIADSTDGQALLWDNVRLNPSFEVLRGTGATYLNMMCSAGQTFAGVLAEALRATQFLDTPQVRKSLEKSSFDLADLKTAKQGVSLFLCLPSEDMDIHFRWLRMMITLVVREVQRTRTPPATGHPLLLVLDEFAALKRMEIIETAVAQIRAYGVKLLFVLQSLEQLKAIYDKNWETFMANCSLKLFFDVGDYFTREYVSKYLGDTQVTLQTKTTEESVADTVTHTTGSGVERSAAHSQGGSSQRGGGRSQGSQSGTSEAEDWGRNRLLFRNTSRYFSVLRKNERLNVGHSQGTSEQTEENWSSDESWQKSRSESHRSEQSKATGETSTRGAGTAEVIETRRLATADEIGKLFAKVADQQDSRHPGWALVIIDGKFNAPVRRSNYYHDPEFIGLFDSSPFHPETAPKSLLEERAVFAPSQEVLNILSVPDEPPPAIQKWLTQPGQIANAEDCLFTVAHVRPLPRTYADANKNLSEAIFEQACLEACFGLSFADGNIWVLTQRAGVDCKVAKIDLDTGPLIANAKVGTILVNRRHEFQSNGGGSIEENGDEMARYAQRLAEADREIAKEKRAAEQEADRQLAFQKRRLAERIDLWNKRQAQSYERSPTRRWRQWRGLAVAAHVLLIFAALLTMLLVVGLGCRRTWRDWTWLTETLGYWWFVKELVGDWLVVAIKLAGLAWLALAATKVFNAADDFFMGRKVPNDNIDADVAVSSDGSVSVTPASIDGKLTPEEALAFAKTVFLDWRKRDGTALECPPTGSSAARYYNLAMERAAFDALGIKVLNADDIKLSLYPFAEERIRAESDWKEASIVPLHR